MGKRDRDVIWHSIHKLRWLLAGLVAVVVAVSALFAARVGTDPSNHAVFMRDEAYQQNHFFQQTFGNDDSVVIGLSLETGLTDSMLSSIWNLSEKLNQHPSVQMVQSITHLPRFERQMIKVTTERAADPYMRGEESLSEYRAGLQDNLEISASLLNAAEDFTAIVTTLNSGLSALERKAAIEEIQALSRAQVPARCAIYFSGTAVEQDRFVAQIKRDHDVFVPVTFGLIMLTLLLLHGHPRALLYPAVVIVASLFATQACMALAGIKLNMMTTLVSPAILIVSVGDVVHLQAHAKHVGRQDRSDRLLKALFNSLAAPCLLTTLTTMAGFLSLAFNPVPAVREFGFFAALGTGFALLWTVLLAPVFFAWHVRQAARATRFGWQAAAAKISVYALRHRKIIIAGAVLALILGVLGIQKIGIETDILGSFKADDRFRQDTEMIHKKLGGVYPLELIIHAPGENAFLEGTAMRQVMALKARVASLDGISNVNYVTDIIQVIDRAVRGSDAGKDSVPPEKYLTRYLNEMRTDASGQIDRVAANNYEWTRMSAFLTLSSTAAVTALAEQISLEARALLPKDWSLVVTGQTYLLARMSQGLVKSEIQSILIAFGIVGLLLVGWFRSLKVGLIGLVVNLIPVVLISGSMPVFHIKLNTATAMIGAVAVGLIIDNTIHVLFRFREASRAFEGDAKVVEHVMNYCAEPLISAALVLMCGFSVTLMGSILPTIQFGFLMVMIIFAALIANLLILPVLLLHNTKRESHENL